MMARLGRGVREGSGRQFVGRSKGSGVECRVEHRGDRAEVGIRLMVEGEVEAEGEWDES